MELNIIKQPRELLIFEGARIIFRNFSGIGSKFNREGERNFAIVIPSQEAVDALIDEGWNVKIKKPTPKIDSSDTGLNVHQLDEDPFMYLPIKIKFTEYGPKATLISGKNEIELDEETIGMIDDVDILECNIKIRPYDWTVNGKDGRTAYLSEIEVIQRGQKFSC